jgi:hypothetical protein
MHANFTTACTAQPPILLPRKSQRRRSDVRVYLKVVLTACAMAGSAGLASASEDPGVPVVWHALITTSPSPSAAIGERSVEINVADTGAAVTFIRVHQNEMPAGAVGTRINAEVPSRFIDLSQRGTREIAMALGGREYSFDPNRIFSPEAAPAAITLADAITSLLLPHAPVIALHNNRGTLLASYASGPFKGCTRAVYVNPHMDASTFAVVSTRSLFDAIERLGINVVWENRAGANDDGSLLAYAQRHDIPYVNVEAGQGSSAEAQLNIVRQVVRILPAAVGRPRSTN